PDEATVWLAHEATITPEQSTTWQTHLNDYNIDPLFNQFGAKSPTFTEGATFIDDHQGWLSDTFAIRGRATKRGYSRGDAEDGGSFSEYVKELPGEKISIMIEFTGSFAVEEQMGAAVTRLSFQQRHRPLPLAEVPPILFAESFADYVFIAEAGAYDPDWERKSGF
ncbi:MAG: DUF4132 domain-containing protein, partial [Propionibacteriaceae bacterium]|nr:DUF4132 domain-containing protein [Propionibacteriaceae bacterium]